MSNKTLSQIPLSVVSNEYIPTKISHETPEYDVEMGGNQTTYYVSSAQTMSSQNISFNITPPSVDTIINDRIMMTVPVRTTLTGSSSGPTLIQDNIGVTDAFRYFPIQNALVDNFQITVNNMSVQQNSVDLFEPLSRYDTNKGLLMQSCTPSYPDQSLAYSDLYGSQRNPLGSYGAGSQSELERRGGYSDFVIVSDDGSTCIVDAVFTEYISLSPFNFSLRESPGLFGINQLNIIATIRPNGLSRLWSHDSINGNTLTSVNSQIISNSLSSGATLQLKYYTPSLLKPLPKSYSWNYNQLTYYPKAGGSVNSLGTTTLNSDSLQLSSVPKRVYIYARRSNSTRKYYDTDSYLRLDNLNITFNNQNGLLSSASRQQLYQISFENGCQMSYSQFTKQIGSVMCVEFSKDIGLQSDITVGSQGSYQLQIQATFTNLSSDQMDVTLYIVPISSGVVQMIDQQFYQQVGIISPKNVLTNSKNISSTEYYMNNSNRDFYGGISLDSVKKSLKDVFKVTDKISKNPYARKAATLLKDVSGFTDTTRTAANLIEKYGPAVYDLAKHLVGAGIVGGTVGNCCKMIERGELTGNGIIGGRKKPKYLDQYADSYKECNQLREMIKQKPTVCKSAAEDYKVKSRRLKLDDSRKATPNISDMLPLIRDYEQRNNIEPTLGPQPRYNKVMSLLRKYKPNDQNIKDFAKYYSLGYKDEHKVPKGGNKIVVNKMLDKAIREARKNKQVSGGQTVFRNDLLKKLSR